MKRLVIDRATWARGGKKGITALLNKDGNKCCLGFALLDCGVEEDSIYDLGLPSDVIAQVPLEAREDLGNRLGWLVQSVGEDNFQYFDDGDAVALAVNINDEPSLSESARESMLKQLFMMNGVELTFTGPYLKGDERIFSDEAEVYDTGYAVVPVAGQ